MNEQETFTSFDGTVYKGEPPPNWYLAQDGRWYPQPGVGAPTATYGPHAAIAAQRDHRAWFQKKRFLIPIVAVMSFVAIGVASSGTDSGGDQATQAGGIQAASDSPDLAGTTIPTDETTPAVSIPAEPEGGEADDFVSCTSVDGDRYQIEVVNQSTGTSTYEIDLVFFDESGARIGDTFEFVEGLRSGERAIEERFAFIGTGFSSCELLELERWASTSDEGELAEVTCAITGSNVLDDIEGTVTATNGTPKDSDYSITVAFVDVDGVRRGSDLAFIERVRPGEEASSELFSTTDHSDGLTCHVVGVERTASL